MIRARIIPDTRSKAKKGFPVKIYVSGDGKKKYISTGFFCRDWERKDRELVNYLRRREYDLAREVAYCNENRLSFEAALQVIETGIGGAGEVAALRERLAELEGRGGTTLFEFWGQYRGELAAQGKSVRALDETLVQVQNFMSDIPIREVNYEWLREFSQQKYVTGCGPAGVSMYLRTIRRVYLEAQRRPSMGIPAGNPFTGVIPSVKRKEKPRMSREEFAALADYTPRPGTTRANAERIRERLAVFRFQVLIGGHDLIDVARLTWEDVGTRVRLTRYKNRDKGGELVDNLLVPEASEIIRQVGRQGRKRVFSFIPDPVSEPVGYRYWQNNYNRMLRVVSEDFGIRPGLSTKSPRYIFRTWAGEAGADILATMQIQGHRARGMTFVYQNRLPDRIVDRVLKEILTLSENESV